MRIVMITSTYTPSANGVAVSISELKQSLEKRGQEVFLFAPDNKGGKVKEKNVFRYPSIDNPIHKDYPIPIIPIDKFLIKTLPKKKPDIIHVHHAYHIGYFAKLLAEYFKVPLVFTYHTNHDLYAKKYISFLPKSLRDIFLNNTVYEYCRDADLVISPAQHTTRKLLGKVKKINVVTIPSAVSIKAHKVSKKFKKENGYDEKKILLTVGRLSKEKSIDFLIRVMKFLPNGYLLLIAGDGPDENKLKKLVHDQEVQNKVKFLGKVEHKSIGTLYALADAFIFASDTETQGLVFLEAMKFGLPIITINSNAAREWIKDGIGEISPKKPALFAEKVLGLDKKHKNKNSVIAKNIAKKFSPDLVALKVEEAYESVLHSPGKRRTK